MKHAVTTSVIFLAAMFGCTHANAQGQPSAVTIARATKIPACTLFVDAAASGNGTAQKPLSTIAAAADAAKPGAVICVAEGTYEEEIAAGEKFFTLAGGFQSGGGFKVRDSAKFVSKAQGSGSGSFLKISDPGPKDGLTAIDGFEITGYSQAILREFYESQRFDITNNFIHDNTCTDQTLVGGGFSLHNVSGTIAGNVIQKNACGRGGAGFLNDAVNANKVLIKQNFVDGNSGTEPSAAHGGGLYFFGNTLEITGNLITNNEVTNWGGGLYLGAYLAGNQPTKATMSHNIYRGNKAGDSGGGFFCDDGAECISSFEVYDSNCGGNILVDGGAEGSGPNRAKFDHITNVGALEPGCGAPGAGLFVDTYDGLAADNYSVTNSIFWGNAPERDLQTSCGTGCAAIKVNVASSLVQKKVKKDGGINVTFGAGIIDSVDPQFVAPDKGDFRLQPGSPAEGLGAYGAGDAAPPAVSAAATSEPAAPVPAEAPAPPVEAAQAAEAPAAPVITAQSGGADDVSAKEAFQAAKELGTPEAWNAFIARFPSGFYGDLARAYLLKLGANPQPPARPTAAAPPPAAAAPKAAAAAPPPAAAGGAGPVVATGERAIARGADYMGFPEQFNRYYTDPDWKPSTTVFVSADGSGNGETEGTPASAKEAFANAKPGTQINFAPGKYNGCFDLEKENSGTYDDPVVIFGGGKVSISCCTGGRKTCINLEQADYVAVDGFELIGGSYGVRGVGTDYAASQHQRGIAVLNNVAHDQERDPFFTGHSDWAVFEGNTGFGAKKGDGHGIYLSNGGDWNIVRFNETYSNVNSDFQINADPNATCKEVGIAFDDPRCEAYAGEGEGGQGASDYFLVDSNYFHHNTGQGPNFTSVRRSVIRNNIFGANAKHGVSFWQESDNPKLGSSDNKILHNLFVSTGRHAVQFVNNSTRNEFANNVLVGIQVNGGKVSANPKALLMEADDTSGENVYRGNFYASGKVEGREPNSEETATEEFSPAWFAKFPAALNHDVRDYTPTADAPFVGTGQLLPDAPVDTMGTTRADAVDLGPIELP